MNHNCRCVVAIILGLLFGRFAGAAGADDLISWQFDLTRTSVYEAWITPDTVYLRLPQADRSTRDDVAATPGLEPLTYENKAGYSPGPLLAAVDTHTGKLRWARPYLGEFSFVLDPEGRDIWAMANGFSRLSADTGKTLQTVPFAPKPSERAAQPNEWRTINALKINEVLTWGGTRFGRDVRDPVRAYDIDANQIVDAMAVNARTADRLNQIDLDIDQSPTLVQTHAQFRPIGGGNATWRFTTPGYSQNRPVMFGRDVLVLSGMPTTVGRVTLLNGADGNPRWTTPLAHGAYTTGQMQLKDGWYGMETWSAVGALDVNRLFAIGGDGTVFIIDAKTGAIIGRSGLISVHLCPPRMVGDQLMMAGEDKIVAVPMSTVISETPPKSAIERLDSATKAIATHDAAAAVKIASDITEQLPTSAMAWQSLAAAAASGGQNDLRVRAASIGMEISQQQTDPSLAEFPGFVARIDTGPLRSPIAPLGFSIYAASTDGFLYVIDAETRQVERRAMLGDASTLVLRGSALVRHGDDRRDETLLTTAAAIERPQRSDPLYRDVASDEHSADQPPHEWTTVGGGFSSVIKIDGRMIRTVTGGGVRELKDNQLIQHAPVMEGVRQWTLVPTAAGPVGCGEGGAFQLDENYRPKNFLIDLRGAGTDSGIPSVLLVDRDTQTLAAILQRPSQLMLTLEIRSADGKKTIRSEPVLRPGRFNDLDFEQTRLFKLGEGYFYAGGELVWLPIDPAKPAWRFRVNATPAPNSWIPRNDSADRSFGIPRRVGDQLFVPNRFGGVYVFNVNGITG